MQTVAEKVAEEVWKLPLTPQARWQADSEGGAASDWLPEAWGHSLVTDLPGFA